MQWQGIPGAAKRRFSPRTNPSSHAASATEQYEGTASRVSAKKNALMIKRSWEAIFRATDDFYLMKGGVRLYIT